MKKYELTNETITIDDDIKLYRIKACRQLKLRDKTVNVGDLGGYIQSESNLSHEGNSWIYDDARVYDNATVFGDASVYDNARVYGYAKVYGDAIILDNARVYGKAEVNGDSQIFSNTNIHGDSKLCGTIVCGGNISNS